MNKYEIEYIKNYSSGHYFVCLEKSNVKGKRFFPYEICDISKKEYRKILKEEFNAVKWGGLMAFKNKNDAKEIEDWLDSLLLAKTMEG
jgi:hypothetical protein